MNSSKLMLALALLASNGVWAMTTADHASKAPVAKAAPAAAASRAASPPASAKPAKEAPAAAAPTDKPKK